MTLVVEPDPQAAATLVAALAAARSVTSFDDLRHHLDEFPDEEAIVIGASVDLGSALRFSERMRLDRPTLGVVLVRRRVDSTLLADALRAGLREVVEERDLSGLHAAVRRTIDLTHALREMHSGGAAARRHTRARTITVFAAKGGCGKTTFAINLAAALSKHGGRTCLVDLDLAFGDVAISLQLMPQHTIAHAVPLAETLDRDGVLSLLTHHSSGLEILAAPSEPYLPEPVSAAVVGKALDVLTNEFDWVVVDTPPGFEDHVLHAFDRSDLLVLLVTPDIPALKNLKLTLDTLDLLNYPPDIRRVVLNREDAKVGLSVSDIEHTLNTPLSALVPSSRDVPASINHGTVLVLDRPRHPVSTAIQEFASEVAETVTPRQPAPRVPERVQQRPQQGRAKWRAKRP
jgi:pilus assembly protein CpaE